MRRDLHTGDEQRGGIVGYPLDSLYEEVAYIAYHFHWPLGDILNLEHGDRQRFMEEIAAINRRMNEEEGEVSASSSSGGIPLQFWPG